MKKIISGLLVLIFSFCLVACGNGTPGSQSNVTRDQLIGDWIHEDYSGTQYITLTQDGKYITEIKSDMGFTYNAEHKWTYVDGVFTVNYEDYGTTSVYNKVTLDGDNLSLDNGEGVMVLQRIK